MINSEHESTAAWRELIETVGGLDRTFLEGDRAVTDDQQIADGYRMLATTLGVAFDTCLFGEPSRPVFVAVTPHFGVTADGAATTPMPTTTSVRSTPAGAIASVATAATACTSR